MGSTTLKCVVLAADKKIVYKEYERHFSQIAARSADMLRRVYERFPEETVAEINVSGSAGMGFADNISIPFVQEVYATRLAVNELIPNTDVVIELGGEDAKILFLSDTLEVRMNGSCAGGTGAFIDQMATLLNITPDEINNLAKDYEKIYTIASRCGVFAKSDIQSILNQGAKKNDVAASIFVAVVNQTIAGLAQGREIKGNVVYLGGPLTFLSELRMSFDRTLHLKGFCPENSLYCAAIGAAYTPVQSPLNLTDTINRIERYTVKSDYISCVPLFKNPGEYRKFKVRHSQNAITISDTTSASEVYLGIDAGSTTVKALVIDANENVIHSKYLPNSGNPVPLIYDFLTELYQRWPKLKIFASAVTGYGEEIIKNAFCVDFGLVETIAHFTAAKKFKPDVDFIIDIGGQDIKCFKIRKGAVDSIFLNEACSSGCGSFLQTFAGALGYSISDFATKGIMAENPVDLGSRCTVFMNSSVKQAQKDGASIENISAGLSISVVKNAIYKVIRAAHADDLGQNIIVQGGTFLNDAVLRAFEQEIEREVVRPNIAGLMGAYGAALYAKANSKGQSTILSAEKLKNFTHKVKANICQGCSNHCRLTINTFDGGRKFIGGNRCERPLPNHRTEERYNLYTYILSLLEHYLRKSKPQTRARAKIGIPLGLNMFELLPFWHTLLIKLGFEVIISPPSNRKLYLSGQHTIPSDTVCFPAKLMHGHVESLIKQGAEAIFYPCLTYNFDENLGDNHYNCPVVAYYPEVIQANIPELKKVRFVYDYLGLHRPKDFVAKIYKIMVKNFEGITLAQVKEAVRAAYNEYYSFMKKIRIKGSEYLALAKEKNLPVIVLAGRPYHLDPEVNHGIDTLICDLGAVVVSEASISHQVEKFPTQVLNQWTYHSRLYAAAKFIADLKQPNINLVQLVSFGCGIDAITADEVRRILEKAGRIYTQIKIDEITNLGAVKIRLRSLFAALKQGKKEADDAGR